MKTFKGTKFDTLHLTSLYKGHAWQDLAGPGHGRALQDHGNTILPLNVDNLCMYNSKIVPNSQNVYYLEVSLYEQNTSYSLQLTS